MQSTIYVEMASGVTIDDLHQQLRPLIRYIFLDSRVFCTAALYIRMSSLVFYCLLCPEFQDLVSVSSL